MISSNARPTVVLADDHPAMLAEIEKFLRPHCNVVAAVDNGLAAMQAVVEWRPDLAVLDITMPGMSGIEVAERLRDSKSSTRIIFLTVQSDPEYRRAADALGALFVLKSRMRSDLLPALEQALGRQLAS